MPSHLYSYSFAANLEWTRSFSTQPKIEDYLRRVARKAGVVNRHLFGCEVTRASWQSEQAAWQLATSHGMFTADVLVGAFSALADRIAEIRGDAVVAEDGTSRPVDAIVIATGFHVTDSPMFERICGVNGRSLTATFDEQGMRAYKGTTMVNFPNMFVLVGPNTGLGHTSMVYMIESQLNYLVDGLDVMKERRLRTIEVKQEAQDAYHDELQRKLAGSV